MPSAGSPLELEVPSQCPCPSLWNRVPGTFSPVWATASRQEGSIRKGVGPQGQHSPILLVGALNFWGTGLGLGRRRAALPRVHPTPVCPGVPASQLPHSFRKYVWSPPPCSGQRPRCWEYSGELGRRCCCPHGARSLKWGRGLAVGLSSGLATNSGDLIRQALSLFGLQQMSGSRVCVEDPVKPRSGDGLAEGALPGRGRKLMAQSPPGELWDRGPYRWLWPRI